MKFINKGICAPQGFLANGVHCGIRKNKSKLDLALIYSETVCAAAALHTTNKVIGAPNTVTKANLSDGIAQAIICNSGNANTCNADGIDKAKAMCNLAAKALKIDTNNVIVASTGVIGQTLPIEPIEAKMCELASGLNPDGSLTASQAIMTTDTFNKQLAIEFELNGGVTCRIGAIAKGSGMIHPNMATMLSFVTTDVMITAPMLDKALRTVADDTFNMVSVDGDTSTNDMLAILANGEARNQLIDCENDDFKQFTAALREILTAISKELARDGEGATKLVTCNVSGASNKSIAKAIAKSVITSNLLKCALFAADANWGRILCAIGYANCDFAIDKVDVEFASDTGNITVCKNGIGVEFDDDYAHEILSCNEVVINVSLNDGAESATAWGCDLSYDYIKINADYRT